VPASRRDVLQDQVHRQDPYILEQFTALGAAAAVTSHLKVGTGMRIVAQRDPIILAKQVVTIDHLSGGRFLFGAAAGWLVEEMRNHGVEPQLRWDVMREKLRVMKAIWAPGEAEFHGEFINFDPIWLGPKPVQAPHPPVLVGGNGPRSLRMAAEQGDAWAPIVADVPEFQAQLTQLKRQCEEAAGRLSRPWTRWPGGLSTRSLQIIRNCLERAIPPKSGTRSAGMWLKRGSGPVSASARGLHGR
jgi:probable F420-dependent oxidoreductase